MLASLQAFPADRRYSRYMKPMRQADGLQTLFVDAAMQADVDSERAMTRRSWSPLWNTTDAARRPGLNVMLCGDRLFQQYVVDACAEMEQQRLNYLRFNQNSFHT